MTPHDDILFETSNSIFRFGFHLCPEQLTTVALPLMIFIKMVSFNLKKNLPLTLS